ncbi:Hpt domain-containing protein [Allochromatium tepidum]|uniref:HPt domain-containing protein n=1 Tax=Allochromatium tepidum TaxID=553982 RepID=A0ABM7QIR5_9GAMM|nr:Hpt domain-containing protein [Allochromatium tepidum]BCU05650.1 hypothetical protein Atep_03270 [Allochromatium tepidum]
MRGVRGRVEVYARLLRTFVEHHGEDGERLRLSLRDGEIETARRLVHTLKGVAANLGATRLPALAVEPERLFKQAAPESELEPARRRSNWNAGSSPSTMRPRFERSPGHARPRSAPGRIADRPVGPYL